MSGEERRNKIIDLVSRQYNPCIRHSTGKGTRGQQTGDRTGYIALIRSSHYEILLLTNGET